MRNKGLAGFGEVSMNMDKMNREQISALADSELADSRIDVALAALRQTDERAAWDIYHQIGDVLRSDEMAVPLRPDFSARMAARLEAEPTIIASFHHASTASQTACETVPVKAAPGKRALKRFAMPGMVAVAAATAALMAAPQLMVAKKESPANANEQIMIASANRTPTLSVSHASVAVPVVAAKAAAVSSTPAREDVVLRDPRIDEYLLAHQRFSPSVYSTAQFARSATFATDSDK